MKSLPSSLGIAGGLFLSATLALAISQTPLGSRFFFVLVAVMAAAYAAMLARIWREKHAPRRLLYIAFAFAVAFRLPLAIPLVGADSDMVRYLWDGRVQRLGYNPYLVLPADPAMEGTHTEETRLMPSRRARTPYPPGAQLFFRLVVAIHDSTRAMKLALVGCDLLTIVLLWRWLAWSGRSEWLALAYAWNPLVVLEIAHSGHVDALGALWITASAYCLARRRTALASIAFVLAVTTKLLPIVLVPLFWKRIRLSDAAAAAIVLAGLYLPFMSGPSGSALGAVPNVVAYIRFNGPIFKALAHAASPDAAAIFAVGVGLLAAMWARARLAVNDPAGWAWPMAAALACAPVVYPWYLLYITPFLFTTPTLPLIAWTFAILPVYIVWDNSRRGERWVVPSVVMVAEYGLTAALALLTLVRRQKADPAIETTANSS